MENMTNDDVDKLLNESILDDGSPIASANAFLDDISRERHEISSSVNATDSAITGESSTGESSTGGKESTKDSHLTALLSNDLANISKTLVFIVKEIVKTEIESAMSNIREEIAEKVVVATQMRKAAGVTEAPSGEYKQSKVATSTNPISSSAAEVEKNCQGKNAATPIARKVAEPVKAKGVKINGTNGGSSKMTIAAVTKASQIMSKIRKSQIAKNGGDGGKSGKKSYH